MRKADRLFQLVNIIRSHQPITAEQLAERIGVSVRTIYRYIDDLSVSGIPVYGEPGVGYALDEDFELPPLTLNHDEIAALMLGVEMLSRSTGSDLAEAAKTLLDKIGAVLPSRSLNPNYTPVRALGEGLNDHNLRHWNELYRAIQQKQTVRITYLSLNEETSQRVIFPLGLFFWGGKWTTGTWCQLRNSYRDFRVDRIKSLDFVLDIGFPEEVSLEAYTSFNLERIKLFGFN
ncbi:YafY family transcriptional regulator [Nodosilinea sp. LEGE 06152]|uniref:helix-turn-helix transcriptional regulator n=1 Tax=Nodosilinea sp. LEGE 06152 TaxID=2777966 RepID=UPI001881DFE3|nr:YafY family protein [Nodosilinea sp. LEGE 06152]MBE9159604.1 YafY family transcriptional regulator [Nodosilinea sp. LEGE 06152]